LLPDRKQEISNIGQAMSSAFYLEKLGKIIDLLFSDQSTQYNKDSLVFDRCIELMNNAS
jgi:hypothetical protein